MSEFDNHSFDYDKLIDQDIRVSGESIDYFASYKARCVKEFLGCSFKGSILDYGCGVGIGAKHLKRYFDSQKVAITGYDVSKESIQRAIEEVKDIIFIGEFEKISKESFDVIIVANVIHHIRQEERPDFFIKISGLLKKNGYIFIFEHNPYNPITRSVVKKSILDRDASLIELKATGKMLKQAGISILKKRYIVFFPRYLKALRFLEPILGVVPMGAQYLCVGKMTMSLR
ncbi:MAG: class I SAM-dependent methyltransferase [Candidatus Omnitrophota bacterium]|nr:class I SAM-dependent methyltransferase [Candidatus Omnitrophota bacterium]